MYKNIKLLERIYFGFLLILYLLIILTPHIIRSGTWFLAEEFLESIIITFLIIVSYYVLILYRREVNKNLEKLTILEHKKKDLENKINDAFKYIGSINVQIQQIKSVFSDLDKYPKTKKDYKNIMRFLAEKVLGIVNVDWVLFRIINTKNLKIIREHIETRGEVVVLKAPISVSDMLDDKISGKYCFLKTTQENFYIKTFCILPKKGISKEQKILIQAIINQLEMLFLIFASEYYKEASNN